MNRLFVLIFILTLSMSPLSAQDKVLIKRAVLDYIEGFYEGDTTLIARSLHPDLSKFGFGYDEENKKYIIYPMTFRGAIGFAQDVKENPKYAAPKDAVKKIEILDQMKLIANVKVTVYWGVDYLLLAKLDGKWMVTKVLWQSKDIK